jgi:hypothetical protein
VHALSTILAESILTHKLPFLLILGLSMTSERFCPNGFELLSKLELTRQRYSGEATRLDCSPGDYDDWADSAGPL